MQHSSSIGDINLTLSKNYATQIFMALEIAVYLECLTIITNIWINAL